MESDRVITVHLQRRVQACQKRTSLLPLPTPAVTPVVNVINDADAQLLACIHEWLKVPQKRGGGNPRHFFLLEL